MKQLTPLLLAFFLWTCCPEKSNETILEITNNEYVQGKIIIPAQSINYSSGIIRVFINEEKNADKFLRGVNYTISELQDNSIDVFDDVYFKIREENNIQYAVDIYKKLPAESSLYSMPNKFEKQLRMNLHFEHDESTVHTKLHFQKTIDPPITQGGTSYSPIKLIDTSGNSEDVYIKTSDLATLDENVMYYANIVGKLNNVNIVELTEEHTHTYE